MLFNEPKLLKYLTPVAVALSERVSVLFNEPKLLKLFVPDAGSMARAPVSVLFNEPKLLKWFMMDVIRL